MADDEENGYGLCLADEEEIDIASFKDELSEKLELYKKEYSVWATEHGFSFNEGFILMNIGLLHSGLFNLACRVIELEEDDG